MSHSPTPRVSSTGICDCPRCIKETFQAPDGSIQHGRELTISRIRAHKAKAEVERLAQVTEVQEDVADEPGDDELAEDEFEDLHDTDDVPGPEGSAILLSTLRMPPDPPKDSVAVRPRDVAGDNDVDESQDRTGAWVARIMADAFSCPRSRTNITQCARRCSNHCTLGPR